MAATIQQIAQQAGVSRGTVDRVLHNRGKVKPEIAQNILKIAEELGYFQKKHRAAASGNPQDFHLGIILTTVETPTMQMAVQGAQDARDKLCALGANVHMCLLEQLEPQKQVECINELVETGINALAISPSSDPIVCSRLKELSEAGLPIITFNGDLPECGRICFVGMDNDRGGRVAAGLMGMLLPDGGKVLPITAHLTHYAHKQRYSSFNQEIVKNYPNIELLPLQSCFNRDDFAYEIIMHAIEDYPDIKGVYIAANGTTGACDALEQLGLTGKVRVITYDLNPKNCQDLKRGRISMLLDQDAYAQGYRPPLLLYRHVVEGKPIEHELDFTEIRITTKEML